ncbi:MAG: lamin tail domain-containing protein [Flavobacteriales bacterium]|nr:lamin tail domain-containing protein [Flavobacteriales bacterium]
MRIYLTAVFLFVTYVTQAQFSDDFSDGDFTTAPVWAGDDANFEIDASNRLHLLAPAVADTSYLSVPTTNVVTTWDFYVEMDFNPSSSNYTRVYLMSNNADLKGSLNGYYVMVGNTADEVSLYRQDGTSVTEIIDGVDDVVDSDPVNCRVRVTRDAAGNWELFRDSTGGFAFVSEGTTTDATYSTTTHFGVFCKYTSSRSELFWFDELGDPFVDASIPEVTDLTIISPSALDITFSEPLDPTTAENVTNYSVDGGIGNPSLAELDGSDPSLVHLTFGSVFSNATDYVLSISDVEDLSGNPIVSPTDLPFFYFVSETPAPNDVVITEFMADPNPVVGLPEVEYVEIHNRSAKYFDLNGWQITDGSTTETLGEYVLMPGAYVLICEAGDGALFGISNFLEGDGIPALTNGGDDIVIKAPGGETIDSIQYTSDWYNDPEKDDGGWSIEREHLDAPCNDISNWRASVNSLGGTPGLQNSVWTDVDDTDAPLVSSFTIVDAEQIFIEFNEQMDTTVSANVTLNPSITSLSWNYTNLTTLEVNPLSLEIGVLYDLTLSLAADCWGNPINQVIKVGLPDSIEAEDIILNEVMFNPLTGGSDYVELYNHSDKILNLEELWIANWDDDTISNWKSLTDEQRLILPGEYVLLTEDTLDIINDFMVYGLGSFLQVDDLPTYPNDSGTVYLISKDSIMIDYFHYDEDYHFDLLSDEDGKSLERISFDGGMNNPDNWHTASEAVEWGTPGYENSQFMNVAPSGTITVDPQLFSPDNDGYNDVVTISLELAGEDNVVDIDVFDNQGRLIRQLKDNFFVGTEALVSWDGINDEGTKASIGTYVILVSVLDANNNREKHKLVCVLGGNL